MTMMKKEVGRMTVDERQLISTIYDRLLIEDDTEESVSGSDFHLAAILALYDVLLRYAQDTPRDWYVTAEVMILVDVPDRARNPWKPMPDVYVVLDTPDTPRTSLDTRVGASFPQFICEVASESTWEKDVVEKQRLYADLGTQEYILFDPTAEFLGEPLRAWHRLPDGSWGRWPRDDQGFLDSTVLGLRLRVEGRLLRVYDPVQGLLPLAREWQQRAEQWQRREHERTVQLALARQIADERVAQAQRAADERLAQAQQAADERLAQAQQAADERLAQAQQAAEAQAQRLAALQQENARLKARGPRDA